MHRLWNTFKHTSAFLRNLEIRANLIEVLNAQFYFW